MRNGTVLQMRFAQVSRFIFEEARQKKAPGWVWVCYLPALFLEQLESLAKTIQPQAELTAWLLHALHLSFYGVISEMKVSYLFVLPGYSSLFIYSFCKHVLDGDPGTGAARVSSLGGGVSVSVVEGENCGMRSAMASSTG